MEFSYELDNSFILRLHDQPILIHTNDQPLFYIGQSQSQYQMNLGHFINQHQIIKKVPLHVEDIKQLKVSEIYQIFFSDQEKSFHIQLEFHFNHDSFRIEFPRTKITKYIQSVIEDDQIIPSDNNRLDNYEETNFWFSLESFEYQKETIRGCGLQYTDGDLRGKEIPIWVSEWYHNQLYSDELERIRPPLNTSYHPQPMFKSSRGYTFCAYGSSYAKFDFTKENVHQFYFVDMPYRIEINLRGFDGGNPLYPPLAEWVHNGVILGVQGGTEVVEEKLEKMSQCGTKISGIWAQDWSGKRITSFGKRVFWNWKWNEEFYPNLKEKIIQWKDQYEGCRFLTYINPYIAVDGSLFTEANENDYLVKRLDSEEKVYLIDFGEFDGGIVDLTNPRAFQWYKKVIQKNLIDIGISGWMADFGEYLPCDVRVHANIPGSLIHNLWPILWARCNHEAIRDAGKLDEIIFFMRSGYLNIQRYCPLFWTGDQSVDFSNECGLPAGLRSALSLSLSGILCIHTDIGGYFSRKNQRSNEVLLRWCEMETFNILMRTHEGNRPSTNVQFDHDLNTMKFFSRMSQIHFHLKPYSRHVLFHAHQKHQSSIIPLNNQEYFFGDDLLIAPVLQNNTNKWNVIIPDGEWIHLWTQRIFYPGEYEVDAPVGYPPVFYRSNTQWKDLFEEISKY